jgi:hypothetical protein
LQEQFYFSKDVLGKSSTPMAIIHHGVSNWEDHVHEIRLEVCANWAREESWGGKELVLSIKRSSLSLSKEKERRTANLDSGDCVIHIHSGVDTGQAKTDLLLIPGLDMSFPPSILYLHISPVIAIVSLKTV